MSGAGKRAEANERSSRLDRVGALVTRRPRRVVAVWLTVVAVLAVLGLGLDGKLTTQAIFVEGTATERAHEVVVNEFGDENSVVIMLRGPEVAVERQGRELEARFEAMPRALVLSPWTGGGVEGLRPSPRVAALVVTFKTVPGEGLPAILDPVRQRVDETVAAPVRASVAGPPAIVDSIQSASERAAALGERIAVPVLLIVLLLVFRSVLAAVMPVVIGGAVVAATRGVLDLLLVVVEIDIFALGAVGMMGLALGVDYSLLVVSRYREEVDKGAAVADAVQRTVTATGRTVITAGTGLCVAMLVAAQILPGAIVASVALAVVVASVLSVASAVVVVPAILMLLGPRLDRWSLPRRVGGTDLAARWSRRLSARPRLALPVVFFLFLASVWAFTLDTGITTVALLPPGDAGRVEQEEVQRELGPGWLAPMEVVMDGGGEPLTTPARLRKLAEFQREVERDPGVATMTGFAGIERATKPLADFEESLTAQQRGLGRLNDGISRVHDGAVLNTEGLLMAADGAARLDSAIGATEGGAGMLAGGLRSATDGSVQLSGGLARASGGSGKLAEGTSKASTGAGKLSTGLARAAEKTGGLVGTATSMETAMRTGEQRLDEVGTPIEAVEARLAAAQEALLAMTAGRGDPQYSPALKGVEEARAWLTGIDPGSGEESAETDGVVGGVRRARSQLSLGLYLAQRLSKNGDDASEGMEKLARGSERLDHGLERLTAASGKMSEGLAQLSSGGQKLSPGLERLSEGAARLADGLGAVQEGSGGLAGGLAGGAEKSKLLSGALGKINRGVERSQGEPGESQVDRLEQRSPGLFSSPYFYLASLDGARPGQRDRAGFLVSLDRGGSAARMLVIPRFDAADSRAPEMRDRLEEKAVELAEKTGTEVSVGGVASTRIDIDEVLRDQGPLARLALALITLMVLIPVMRSLSVPILAALLNVATVAATFGILALLFDGSLLGGPGYVDTAAIPATIMVIFGLAIDYEVFIFARVREEYVRTGSTEVAITDGLARSAPVVTGAALIMIVVFLSFAVSPFASMRNFGVAQAVGVAIDAFLIRLIVVPAMMRALGDRVWWIPGWLDRILPGTPTEVALRKGGLQ